MRGTIVALVLGGAALLASAGAVASGQQTVTGVVGPAFNISLKEHAKAVKVLAPGSYVFSIHDNSNIHNFHLSGPGVNRKTGVAAKGTTTWRVTLRKGTYRFVCDPHASTMRGSFIVRAP